MYKCKMCIVLAGFLFPLLCAGQSTDQWVIGSGGNSSHSGSTNLEWTLGETFVATIITPRGMISEGFHQPILEVRRIQEQDLTSDTEIQVFPVPTYSQLFVNLNQVTAKEQHYWLFDMEGKLVDKGNLGTGKTQTIDVQRLAPGTYLLKIAQSEVLDHPSNIHHFQIIKH